MLLDVSFAIGLFTFAVGGKTIVEKARPYAIFPVPFELPNRNDRSEQCWLRIEDFELVETVTVYCFVVQAFLRSHIHDYNTRKMQEDGVNVSLWNGEPRQDNFEIITANNPKAIKDWKTTTIFDPTVNRRIYVTKKAECKLIMYSREGMTNYRVDCERVLFFINNSTSGGIKSFNIPVEMLLLCCGLVFGYLMNMPNIM